MQPSPTLRPTLKDLAQRCGISVAAASYAMTGSSQVSARTAERVRQTAREMGYVPDQFASAMASRSHQSPRRATHPTLAYVHSYGKILADNSTHLDTVHPALQAIAAESGFALEIHDVREFNTVNRLAGVLYARGVLGIVLECSQQRAGGPEPRDYSVFDPFAVVSVHHLPGTWPDPFHQIRADYCASLRECWKRAHERGYRRIGAAVFAHQPAEAEDYELWGTAAACQVEFRTDAEPVPTFCGAHDDRDGFLTWHGAHRPDAIISMHYAPFWWLRNAGVEVPRDVGLVSVYLGPESERQESHQTGFLSDPRPLAHAAVQSLVSGIKHREIGVPALQRRTFLRATWQEGQTLPRRMVKEVVRRRWPEGFGAGPAAAGYPGGGRLAGGRAARAR